MAPILPLARGPGDLTAGRPPDLTRKQPGSILMSSARAAAPLVILDAGVHGVGAFADANCTAEEFGTQLTLGS